MVSDIGQHTGRPLPEAAQTGYRCSRHAAGYMLQPLEHMGK